ncbi:helix-turn-helix domain-containing protein [Streptomyces yaizuensis]|uniref:Helix-turn-helix domain-containing protein n=2 Tax=Streptomyces yaizuensis TaxID=2989713 RepID=A0ABQ5P6H4_9ACTN|nr:helix-turn-helix domain-containing protein [Streptomyces sp. YSPA8]
MTQLQVGDLLGVAESVIARYESGKTTPPPERLPRLAAAVGHRLDDLFPRAELPTLADLRSDAGYAQKDTAAITRTSSAMPVRAAESGRRPLADGYVALLAEAYGVSREELLAAQERSFGNYVPAVRGIAEPEPELEQPAGPTTIAEKIVYLLETYGSDRPTDADIAVAGNTRTGTSVLTSELVSSLRTGKQTEASDEVLNAIALALDATALIFSTDSPDVARVVAGIRAARAGFTVMAARGGENGGVPPELMDFAASVFQQILDRDGR